MVLLVAGISLAALGSAFELYALIWGATGFLTALIIGGIFRPKIVEPAVLRVDDISDCAFLTDKTGRITARNAALDALFPACIAHDMVDSFFAKLHEQLNNSAYAASVVETVLSEPTMAFTDILRCQSGTVYERIINPAGRTGTRLWILRDITHHQKEADNSDFSTSLLEENAARNAELAEQLYLAKAELEDQQVELTRLASTDPLTGLLNRRVFQEKSDQRLQTAARGGVFCLVMMDLDHFKSVNDTYGHAVGDLVIQDFAKKTRQALEQNGLVARMGGEEFAAFLLLDGEQAQARLETLRKRIEGARLEAEGQSIAYTCSFGLAVINPQETTIENALKSADLALYSAKEKGRNTVILASAI